MEQAGLYREQGLREGIGPSFQPNASLIEGLRKRMSVNLVAETNRLSRFTRSVDLDAFLQGYLDS